MVETIVIVLAVIAFGGGMGLAAALKSQQTKMDARRAKRPSPLAMPATQTADVEAKTGADPAARK